MRTKETDRARIESRFWGHVSMTGNITECWLWTGALIQGGYGAVNFDGKTRRAHRIAWMLTFGDVPKGLVLDHLCRTRDCVNPWHMEPVTLGENTRRGEGVGAVAAQLQRAKTHCPLGHEYDAVNTRVYRGSRNCRPCHTIYMRDWTRKRREEATCG